MMPRWHHSDSSKAMSTGHNSVKKKTLELNSRSNLFSAGLSAVQLLTQINLYSHRSRLEARNFGFKKKSDCTICEAVTAKLVSAFVFAYADFWFSDVAAHFRIIMFSSVLRVKEKNMVFKIL